MFQRTVKDKTTLIMDIVKKKIPAGLRQVFI